MPLTGFGLVPWYGTGCQARVSSASQAYAVPYELVTRSDMPFHGTNASPTVSTEPTSKWPTRQPHPLETRIRRFFRTIRAQPQHILDSAVVK